LPLSGRFTTATIPALGTSVVPTILDTSYADDVVLVSEEDTVAMCQRLTGRGFLFGGSPGTAVAGACTWHDALSLPGSPPGSGGSRR
jgi:cysteine synthase